MGANSITYGYNQANQLTSHLNGSNHQYQYTYDGNGLRTDKTVNDTTEQYAWDMAEGPLTIIQDGSTR